ncbi:MAG: hypothetical protein PSX81_11185 [bacterium]|nr:hypothetical protein [bacterium]
MKKIYLIALILCITNAYSQKIVDETAVGKVTRLPLKPLGKDLKSYTFTVVSPYPENNNSAREFAQKKYNDELANYPNVVAKSEAKYQEDLKRHDEDVKEAKASFKVENDAWEKMTLVERLSLKDQKPVLRLPSKPSYYKPAEPRFVEPDLSRMIVYDTKLLANSYLKLDGYTKGETNALVGKVTLYEFEKMDPLQKSKEVSYYDSKLGQTVKKTEYYYETQYKRAAELVLEYNGTVLYNGIFENSNEFKTITSTSQPNMLNLEKQTVGDMLTEINEFINANCGISQIETKHVVNFVKNKSEEYDDLEKAKNYAISGYTANKYGTVNQDLMDAIDIWKKAIDEADVENKKARIDEKVLRAILTNAIEAATVVNDIQTAEACLKTFEGLKNNNSEREEIKKLKAKFEDAKARFLANQ